MLVYCVGGVLKTFCFVFTLFLLLAPGNCLGRPQALTFLIITPNSQSASLAGQSELSARDYRMLNTSIFIGVYAMNP